MTREIKSAGPTKGKPRHQTGVPNAESQTVEFKTSFDGELIETLSAFANTRGGVLYLGVGDKGNICGINNGKESVAGWLNQIKTSTTPSIFPDADVLNVQGRTIARFTMPE